MKFVEYPEDKKTDSPKETEGQTRGGWFPNGNIFWTMVLMFAFLALINTFLFPGSRGSSVVETDYGTFISDVDKGLVYDVVIDGDKVLYSKSAPLTYLSFSFLYTYNSCFSTLALAGRPLFLVIGLAFET